VSYTADIAWPVRIPAVCAGESSASRITANQKYSLQLPDDDRRPLESVVNLKVAQFDVAQMAGKDEVILCLQRCR
jgi:hypothetical protein